MRKTWNCSGYFLSLLVCWFLFYSPITLARAGICRISTQPTELLSLVCRALPKRAGLVYAKVRNNSVEFDTTENIFKKKRSVNYSSYINMLNILILLFIIIYVISIKYSIDKRLNKRENIDPYTQNGEMRKQIFNMNLQIDQHRRYVNEEILELDEKIKKLHAQRLLEMAAHAIEYEKVYNLASKSIDEALEIEPADHTIQARGQALKSRIFRKTRRFEEASAAIHDALKSAPDHPLYLYEAACCSALMNRSEEAVGLLARCFEHEPALRERALQEPAFENVRETQDFLTLCFDAYQGEPRRESGWSSQSRRMVRPTEQLEADRGV